MHASEVNVPEMASEFNKNLKNEVAEAFSKRSEEDLTAEQRYQEFNDFLKGKSDDEVIDAGKYTVKPCEAAVTNPHQYLELLKEAVKTIRPMWAEDEAYIHAEALEKFEHEMGHAVPEMGFSESNIIYGVHFYIEPGTQIDNFFPFIFVEGKTTVGRIKDSMMNVDEMSEGDAVIMKDIK